MNNLTILFMLYTTLLALMSIKFVCQKKLDVKELSVHVGIAVVLGLLVVYVSRNKLAEGFKSMYPFNNASDKAKNDKKVKFTGKDTEAGTDLDYKMSADNGVPNESANVPEGNGNGLDYPDNSNRVEYNGAAPVDYAINLNSDKVTAADKNAGSNLDYRVSSKDGIVTKYSEEPNYDNNNAYPAKMVKRVNYRGAAPTAYQMSSLPIDEANNVVTGNNNNGGASIAYKVSDYDGVEVKYNQSREENLRGPRTNREKAYKGGAPLDYNMGPYSNVRLDTEKLQKRRALMPGFRDDMFLNELESNCGDIKSPCNVPLVKPKFINPMGGESHPELSKIYKPSVDGKSDSPKSMFMFSHNVCHPGCCPSTYSCDHGCVCTTKEQQEYISKHGIMKKN